MNTAISTLLIIVGIINFLPVIGVISAEKLSSAYLIELIGNDMVILMRHRALLFGIVGSFILYAAFNPTFQPAAMTMAAVSMLGFLYFVWAEGNYNSAIANIALVDVLGIVCLSIAVILKYLNVDTQ